MKSHKTFRFSLLVLCLSAAVFAGEGVLSGSGTVSDPYLVADYADLCAVGLGSYSNQATYRLVADIDASASDTAHGDSGFVPITLLGTFHGGGYAIRNLHIHRLDGSQVGLFGFVQGGNVSEEWCMNCSMTYSPGFVDSLTLDGVDMIGTGAVGGVVGLLAGGTVSHCSVSGSIQGQLGSAIGGAVGSAQPSVGHSWKFTPGLQENGWSSTKVYSRWLILGCRSSATVSENGSLAIADSVGGLLGNGNFYGDLDSCLATGNVTDSGTGYVGGLAGFLASNSRLSSATGSVTGKGGPMSVGGLVGMCAVCTLAYDSASGKVVGIGDDFRTGGLVGGDSSGSLYGDFANGAIDVQGARSYSGGLLGFLHGRNVRDIYALGGVHASGKLSYAGGLVGYVDGSSSVWRGYATGKVIGDSGATTGGLVGWNRDSLLACYWDTVSSRVNYAVGKSENGAYADAHGLSSSQMAHASSYSGWDFDSTWLLAAGDTAPRLYQYVRVSTGIAKMASSHRSLCSWMVSGKRLVVAESGTLDVTLFDFSGRVLGQKSGTGTATLDLPSGMVVLATVRTALGRSSFMVPAVR